MAKRKIKELLQADLEKAQPQEQKSDFISAKVLYERDVENIPTLVEPILPKSGIVCIAGASDTGKSAFLRFLAFDSIGV
jgi:polynucleotide 5'-kinase involved in rRNA processing